MSIRHRLAKLERKAPGNRGSCIVLPLYDGETHADALSACPEIEPRPADLLIFVKRYCAAPEQRARPVIWPMVA